MNSKSCLHPPRSYYQATQHVWNSCSKCCRETQRTMGGRYKCVAGENRPPKATLMGFYTKLVASCFLFFVIVVVYSFKIQEIKKEIHCSLFLILCALSLCLYTLRNICLKAALYYIKALISDEQSLSHSLLDFKWSVIYDTTSFCADVQMFSGKGPINNYFHPQLFWWLISDLIDMSVLPIQQKLQILVI